MAGRRRDAAGRDDRVAAGARVARLAAAAGRAAGRRVAPGGQPAAKCPISRSGLRSCASSGQPACAGARAEAWFMVRVALVPLGDTLIVLRHGGTRAVAFGIHFATAVVVLISVALLFLV
ncbi:DUF4267 domain-containing protein [Streptomyces sp. SAS_269]|uniref:DUF4267 domain-containing protein n=1 Tax=Streptomyces sp. SAS_269 TaxID=3412749 RepID=UPI00403CDF2E